LWSRCHVLSRSELLTCASLFFYCYGDARVLRSFPTRRSSDLGRRERAGQRKDHDLAALEKIARLHRGRTLIRQLHQGRFGYLVSDRKSTRLNSSHVKISYAVCCLKKKIKNRSCNYMPIDHTHG